jgi:hypothetical protein
VDFPAQGRNGQGVVAAKPSPKLGLVAGAVLAGPGDTLLCLTAGGGAKPIAAAAVPEMGRPAQGKSVIPLVGGDQVTRIVAVAAEQSRGKGESEVKAERQTGSRPAKAATGATKAAPTKAPAAAAKMPAVKVEIEAKVQTGSRTRKAAAAPITSAAAPPRSRKTAPAQPELLPAAPAKSAPKPPAKPTSATAPKAEPAKAPVPSAAQAGPAAPAEKPAAKETSTEKPGGTAARPAASKAPGPVAKGK